MGRPSQADLLAAQLSQSAPAPGGNTSVTSTAPTRAAPKMSLQARSAIQRREDENDEEAEDPDDDLLGFRKPKPKPKPKQSLIDMLNSEPPWPNDPPPIEPPAPAPTKKKSFGSRFLGNRSYGRSSEPPQPIISDEEERRFRQGSGGNTLRTAQSSTSLRTNMTSRVGGGSKAERLMGGGGGGSLGGNEDDFGRLMAQQQPTKKLTAKGAQNTGSSTRDLADFLRLSEPTNSSASIHSQQSSAPLIRGDSRRRAESTASFETSTSAKLRKIRGGGTKNGVGSSLPPEDDLSDLPFSALDNSNRHETLTAHSFAPALSCTSKRGFGVYDSVSPIASARMHGKMSNGMTRSASLSTPPAPLSRSPSGVSDAPSSSSAKRVSTSRKPVPSIHPDEVHPSHSSTSIPFLSESTLAMILGETEPLETPAKQTPVRSTSLGPNTRGQAGPYSQTQMADARHPRSPTVSASDSSGSPSRSRESSSQTTTTSTPLVTRRPATADENAPPSFHPPARQEAGKLHAVLDPPQRRPSPPPSPPPIGHPPPPPPAEHEIVKRVRPVSIVVDAASGPSPARHGASDSPSRPSVSESLVDPPYSGAEQDFVSLADADEDVNEGTQIDSTNPVFLALQALQASMRRAADLRLDPRSFAPVSVETRESSAGQENVGLGIGLRSSELRAVLPTLLEMKRIMDDASTLIGVVVDRCEDGIAEEGTSRPAEEGTIVDQLLNTDRASSPSPLFNSVSPSDSGVGFDEVERGEKVLDKGKRNETEEGEAGQTTDEDSFPLLVKHLSMGR